MIKQTSARRGVRPSEEEGWEVGTLVARPTMIPRLIVVHTYFFDVREWHTVPVPASTICTSTIHSTGTINGTCACTSTS